MLSIHRGSNKVCSLGPKVAPRNNNSCFSFARRGAGLSKLGFCYGCFLTLKVVNYDTVGKPIVLVYVTLDCGFRELGVLHIVFDVVESV